MSVIPSLRVQTRPRSDDHMPLTFDYVLVNIILGFFTRVVWNGYVWNKMNRSYGTSWLNKTFLSKESVSKGSMYRILGETCRLYC